MSSICPVCGNAVADASSACEMCGFKLVGATQAFHVIDPIRMESVKEQVPLGSSLRVLRGPQIGTVYKLESANITLGRNPHCDIFLNDMTVSRKHAILKKEGTTYRIEDDNSFNGVWVNGRQLESALLKPGDTVQIGTFRLAYEQE